MKNQKINLNSLNENYLFFDYYRLNNAPTFFPDKKRMMAFLQNASEKCLTGRQKKCFFDYYLYGQKQKDIAFELNVSKSTVSRHISKAREKLQSFAQLYQ